LPASIFLAKLIGPVFLAIGIGLLANAAHYRKMAEEGVRSHVLLYLSGILAMSAGLAIVLTHNVWAADWRVLITLLGWLTTIGGAVRIVAPQQSEAMGRRFLEHPQAMTGFAVAWLAVGAVLCLFGYFH
jgi:uncharacterized membrane protein